MNGAHFLAACERIVTCDRRSRLIAAMVLLVLAAAPTLALAQPMPGMKMDMMAVDMPMPLVTTMAMPMSWVELMVMHSKSEMERMYQAFPNVQYAFLPQASVQLTVPLTLRDPKEEPTVGGIGDVDLTGRYAVLLLKEQQFVLTGALSLGFPTGDESRELGGEWAIAPALLVGKGFGPLTLQAELRYRFRLDSPSDPEVEKDQRFIANVAGHYAFVKGLGGLLEINTVTPIKGEDEKKTQVYLTPGIWAEPAPGWNIRAGVQIPVTSAKEFDYNIIAVVTRTF